ncbi:hypothetical protein Tsubulata_044466 [Turnera subulata]|uniref:(S)-ureidoglycine aminohydrolase cupin domain-containing protein n=1 Tax=Turnera subulata TaxID=218843 RepID=A0A9Q0JBN5_9ROSI|nr:hypothetical protein Tsubulata_044466 [Turnera subulata]
MATASMIMPPTLGVCSTKRSSSNGKCTNGRRLNVKAMSFGKSYLELYNVRVEKKASPERLAELGVSRWSTWKTGHGKLAWDWHVDQLVYIEEGEVFVVPQGCKSYLQFEKGDLVRYPKWFEADLFFFGPYQERYSFRAYGDDA